MRNNHERSSTRGGADSDEVTQDARVEPNDAAVAAVAEQSPLSGPKMITAALLAMSTRTGCPLLCEPTAAAALRRSWARVKDSSAFHVLLPGDVARTATNTSTRAADRTSAATHSWNPRTFRPVPSGQWARVLLDRLQLPGGSIAPERQRGGDETSDRWYASSVLSSADGVWSPWLAAVAAEVKALASDPEYFVFAERVGAMLHALCTDERLIAGRDVVHHVALPPGGTSAVGCTAGGSTYSRPHTEAPWELVGSVCWTAGFAFLVAPLCFVIPDDVLAYRAVSLMHDRFWRYFHNPCAAIDAAPRGEGMAAAIDALSAEVQSDADLTRHLEEFAGPQWAAAVAGRWFATWFAGFIPASQVQLLLDAILSSGNAACVLAHVGVGVLSMRRSALLSQRDADELFDLLFDLGDVEVLPLLT